jgi:glycosyltransferase involved in cell wall biosynthesis
VPPDDAEALAQAVAELLADAALRQSMAAAARRRAEAAFDIQAAATRLMMHYRDVANR